MSSIAWCSFNDQPPIYANINVNGGRSRSPLVAPLPSAPPQEEAKIFSLTLCSRSKHDRIRLNQCSPNSNVEEIIKQTIESTWGGTVPSWKLANGAVELQIHGQPWSEFRNDIDSLRARLMLTKIMKNLAVSGWNFILGTELSKNPKGKDVIFFESSQADADAKIFSLSFSKFDRIRVSGDAPSNIISTIGKTIKNYWPGGIQQGNLSFYGAFEFKIQGNPWMTGLLGVEKSTLLANILLALKREGYKPYGSLRITKKEREIPTLFFRKITSFYA